MKIQSKPPELFFITLREDDFQEPSRVAGETQEKEMELEKHHAEMIVSLLEEASDNLSKLMFTPDAQKLQIRAPLPDELDGCACILREAYGLQRAVRPEQPLASGVMNETCVPSGTPTRQYGKRNAGPVNPDSPHYPFYCVLRDGGRVLRKDSVNGIKECLTLDHPGIHGNPGNIVYYGYLDLSVPGVPPPCV